MRTKSCKHCGRPFEAATKYTYLCPECHAASKTSGVVMERVCRQCGTVFLGGPRAWYCPGCRAGRQRTRSREYRRRSAAGKSRKIGSEDICVVCGKLYTVSSGNQCYCPECAPEAVGRAVREHKRQYAANRAEHMARYKADMSSNRHVCIICGTVFDSDLPIVTCSPDCDKIRRRRNQQTAELNRKSRRKTDD